MKTILACMMLPALLAAADPDELRLRTSLAGGPIRGVVPDGHADFKLRPSRGSMAFSVEVEDVQLPTGTRLDILVNGAYVGQMAVSGPPAMGAELELNTQDGAQVPALKAGDVIEVRAGSAVLLSGVLQTTPLIDSLRNSPPRSTVPAASAGASLPQLTGQEPARLRTPLTGGALAGLQPSGHLDFRTDSARGFTRLSVEVEDVNLPAGTVLQVEIEGRVVTTFRLGPGGFAELELDSRNGDLVNQIRAGAGVRILSPNGPILSGGIQLITPSTTANSNAGATTPSSTSPTTGGNGETRVRTPLAGGAVNGLQPSGKADFRVRGAGSRLNVEIEDVNLPPGSVVDVFVGNQRIGTITVGPPPMRGGELELNTNDGATVPAIRPGDQITIRTAAQGVLVTGVVQTFSFSEVPPVPPAAGSGNSGNSGGSNSNANQAGDDRGGNSGNSGSGSSNSGSGSSNSGSGSSNSGSGSSNSGSGSSNSGSGSSNSGSGGSSNSGSGSSNSGSGSSNSGSGSSNSGSGSSNSGSGSSNSGSGSSNSGSGGSNSGGSNSGGSDSGSGKGGGSDDPPGHN
ncbi:MAG: hypothetical protein IPJ98_11330 [Bryobacterales bacterium]|nr:hypothetical protein [Bryobacterales bacterium]